MVWATASLRWSGKFEFNDQSLALAFITVLAARQPTGVQQNHTRLRSDDLGETRALTARHTKAQLWRNHRRYRPARIAQFALTAECFVV